VNGESVHMGDLLSAYADGELTEAERAAVDAHLPACPACRQELEATRRVKAWVADLPPVDSPFGFLERMLLDPSGPRRGRDRWVIRAGAVSLAATASIWLGVVGLTGLTGNRPGGLPALNSLVSLHQESTPAEDPAADQADQQQIEQEAAALGLPPSMGDYHLQSLIDAGQPQQATYTSDGQILSAFVFEGYDILERRLPAGSEGWLLNSGRAWIVPAEPSPIVLAQVGANVVVLVGPDPAPSMADDLEPRRPDPSVMDRIQGAGEGLLEAFGLG